uniref:Holliday junction resolvase n=1 Tax=viral metagenome TaxID=1070528 RepID=A0A6M3JDI4_9ZZZZ
MVKTRTAKTKGNQLEYSVADSLRPKYPDVIVTKQLGFVAQYDVGIPSILMYIECKRHKGFSWNELKKYYQKLESRTPTEGIDVLVFQANHQPVLVMYRDIITQEITVTEFEVFFDCKFIKHSGKTNPLSIKKSKDSAGGLVTSFPPAEEV